MDVSIRRVSMYVVCVGGWVLFKRRDAGRILGVRTRTGDILTPICGWTTPVQMPTVVHVDGVVTVHFVCPHTIILR